MTEITVTQADREAADEICNPSDNPHLYAVLCRKFAKHRQSSTEEVERAIIWHLLRDGRDVLRSEFLEAEGWHLEAAFDGMIRAGIILPSFPNSSRANSGLQHWSLAMVHPDTALTGASTHG